mmetsp:Transcript_95354/g.248609  ORF Transcript_95354/g.248609 Transcript_95354/m.248609 type:complete len:211 (+) Transcript_95354:54-686(+)
MRQRASTDAPAGRPTQAARPRGGGAGGNVCQVPRRGSNNSAEHRGFPSSPTPPHTKNFLPKAWAEAKARPHVKGGSRRHVRSQGSQHSADVKVWPSSPIPPQTYNLPPRAAAAASARASKRCGSSAQIPRKASNRWKSAHGSRRARCKGSFGRANGVRVELVSGSDSDEDSVCISIGRGVSLRIASGSTTYNCFAKSPCTDHTLHATLTG